MLRKGGTIGLYLNTNADAPDGCAGPVYAFRLTNLEPGNGYRALVSSATGGGHYCTRCRSKADSAFYTDELDGLLEEGLGITGTGLFKEETSDMRYLQSLYRQERGDSIDNTAAYIFILPKASVDGVKGDMPLTRPVGYVFASGDTYADGQTIAHELGHGLYSFQHAFDYMGVSQGETDNLMDYGLPQGEKLAVWQWNLISTHKNYTIPFLTDDEDGWLALTNAPQLVKKGNSETRKFYEKLINEMFDMNQDKYKDLPNGNEFNSELDTLRKFVLGEGPYMRFDWIVQYLYHLADTNTILKKAARDYGLAVAIIVTAANKNLQVKLGDKTEYNQKDNTLYLNNKSEEKMNFITIDKINSVQNPDTNSVGKEKWEMLNKIQDMTNTFAESCNFYTLLHECIHILYYEKIPDHYYNDSQSPARFCGCSEYRFKKVIKLDDSHSIGGEGAGGIAQFRDMAYFRHKRKNYDAAIKVENYFRVNLGGQDKVRTCFGHHGTIDDQEIADLCYTSTSEDINCYKTWCDAPYGIGTEQKNEKKPTYKQVEYFMPITHEIYKLPTNLEGKIAGLYRNSLKGIKKKNSKETKEKFTAPQLNGKTKSLFESHYKSVENQDYKHILNLE